jgi:hypothetical protein
LKLEVKNYQYKHGVWRSGSKFQKQSFKGTENAYLWEGGHRVGWED